MKLKYNSGIVVYMKQYLIWFTIYASFKVISLLAKFLFHKEILTSYYSISIWHIALICFLPVLLITPNYFYIAKAVRLDERTVFYEKTAAALKKMKWKLVEEQENRFIFAASFWVAPWRDKIIVRFTEKELLLYGPRTYVERILELAKFPYGAFEISNFDQAQ